MSKDSSAKYYQNKKRRLQKKLVKDIKVFLKQKNNKVIIWLERYKNLPEDEKQKLAEYRKKYKMKKSLIIIITNYFGLRSNDLENSLMKNRLKPNIRMSFEKMILKNQF